MALGTILAPAVGGLVESGGNPWMAGASIAAPLLGSALGSKSAPPQTNQSRSDGQSSNAVESIFDSSGWVVNFGSGDVSATSQKAAATGGFNPSMIIWLIGGLLAWKMLKSS